VDDEHDAERAPCQAAEAARLALSRGLSGWIIEFHEVVPARRPSRCCVRRVQWRVERAASFAALARCSSARSTPAVHASKISGSRARRFASAEHAQRLAPAGDLGVRCAA
jgi:hypothetical protein